MSDDFLTDEDKDFLKGKSRNEEHWRRKLKGQPSLKAPAPKSLWGRFMQGLEDTADIAGQGIVGATARGISRLFTNEEQEVEMERRVKEERERRAIRDAADPAWSEERGVIENIGHVVSELGGSMVGDANPTYLIGSGAATPLGRILTQGGIELGIDSALQGVEVNEGLQEEFSPRRAAEAFVGGAALQGVGEGVAKGVRALSGRGGDLDLETAVGIGNKFGTVTSTVRSPAKNKAVGGVANSFHLSGQAIDVARGKGVSHKQLERAYKRAGFRLVESIDEGDHSHFAFDFKNSENTAPDGFPANESVAPMDPRELARIMGDKDMQDALNEQQIAEALMRQADNEGENAANTNKRSLARLIRDMLKDDSGSLNIGGKGNRTIDSKPGVNARRMARMLGPQLYGDPSDMGAVSIKEVLQNSFDAIKTALGRGSIEEGSIKIDSDSETRTITMTDNGVGMTPEVLGGKFLEIAGTGKESDNASGGFGIAKMLFLYGNKKLKVITMRDGQVAELNTTGEQLFDALEDMSKAPKINVRNPTPEDLEMFPTGHGTQIKMKIPENFRDPSTGETKDINFPKDEYYVPALKNSPLFANVDVQWGGYPVYGVGKDFPTDKHSTFANVDFGWGTADIYVSNKAEKNWGDNLHILSNGLWQFSKRLGKDPSNPYSENLPYVFYADIHPKVKPDDPGYPFNFNRQSFTDKAGKEFNSVINYINKLYAHKSLGEEAQSFGTVEYIDPATGNISRGPELVPEIPVTSDGFRGIQEGDKVTVKDGRMFVNGKELPPMTPEQLKNAVPSHKELMVDPKLIDPTRIMVHENATVQSAIYDIEEQPLTQHMREKFGKKFDDMLHSVGLAFMELRDMASKIDESYSPLKSEGIGISFDPNYRGVSIRVPFSGSFVNPLVPEGLNIIEQSYGIIGTMIHELAHFKVRTHNADFPAEMQRIMYKLHANEDFHAWQMDVVDDFRNFEDIINYGKELFDARVVKAGDNTFKDGVTGRESISSNERIPEESNNVGSEGQRPTGVPSNARKSVGKIVKELLKDDSGSYRGPGFDGRDNGRLGEDFDNLDPEQKITAAIKAARPVSAEQRRLHRKERAIRGGKLADIQAKGGSVEGLQQELGAVKGELPSPDYESIAHRFTQEDIETLFTRINFSNSLLPFEKLKAKEALMKLLGAEGAKIPTASEIKLLSEVMSNDFIKTLLKNRTLSEKLWHGLVSTLNIPRAVMASMDLSAPFRQGIVLVGRKEFWKSFANMFKLFGSEKASKALMEEIKSRPSYQLMREAGLAITDPHSHFLSQREEDFMTDWAEKIPVFGKVVSASNRAYSGFLNKLRADVFDDFVRKYEAAGVNLAIEPDKLKQISRFINAATGRGSLNALLGKGGNAAAPALNTIFFSPRLIASRVQILADPRIYVTADPIVRKEAWKALLSFGAIALSVAGLAKYGLDMEVEDNPNHPDFMKPKVENTRYDILGGFQQYIRLASQIITNEKITGRGEKKELGEGYKNDTRYDVVLKFLRNKFSPTTSFFADWLDGKNTIGEEFELTKDEAPYVGNSITSRIIPMFAQDLAEAYKEWGPEGLLRAAPGAFGIGTQTYAPRTSKTKEKKISDEDFLSGRISTRPETTLSKEDEAFLSGGSR